MKAETSYPGDPDLVIETEAPEETRALGECLGRALRGGEVIALTGELGAGKTLLVKGIAAGLGIDDRDVTSPTFLLVHELTGRLKLHHLDAYRASGSREFIELGFDEMPGPGSVVAIEWAERLFPLLPEDHLRLTLLARAELSRKIECRALGPRHVDLLRRFERAHSREEEQT